MSNHHFTVKQLSERWDLSTGTLDHWRRYGKGPLFMKIGGHVLYRLSDIEAYEESVVRQETRKDPGEIICQLQNQETASKSPDLSQNNA